MVPARFRDRGRLLGSATADTSCIAGKRLDPQNGSVSSDYAWQWRRWWPRVELNHGIPGYESGRATYTTTAKLGWHAGIEPAPPASQAGTLPLS